MIATRVGFTGGHKDHPTYKEVCKKDTGHAEAVEVTFDPEQTSFETLARYFFQFHDPTINRTDKGGQYRSAIFYQDQEQKATAEKLVQQLESNGYAVKTTLEAAGVFWKAEARHQKYCDSRGMQPKDRFVERFEILAGN
ncbi:MAG: peptide-methionine (S)-S-oxide reductase MsrA [Bacteroidota bacterium]